MILKRDSNTGFYHVLEKIISHQVSHREINIVFLKIHYTDYNVDTCLFLLEKIMDVAITKILPDELYVSIEKLTNLILSTILLSEYIYSY